MKSNIKSKSFLIYMSLLLIILFILFNTAIYTRVPKLSILFIIGILIAFILTIHLIGNSIAKNFIILVISYGIIMIILLPFANPLDEITHFKRAVNVSDNNLFLVHQNNKIGAYLPENIDSVTVMIPLSREISEFSSQKISNNYKFLSDEIKFTNPYSFSLYLPMATGIKTARVFSNKLIYSIYMGRLFNLLAYSVFMYFAIILIPLRKITMSIIALAPVQFLLSSSYSVDGIALGSICLFISYLLRLKSNERINIKESILLILFAFLVITCKSISYMPILLLVFLLRKDQFKNIKHYYVTIGCGLLISLIYIIATLKLLGSGITDNRAMIGTDSTLQIAYILHHPFNMLLVFSNTLYLHIVPFLTAASNSFCYNEILSLGTNILLIIVLILDNRESIKFNKIDRRISVFSIIMTVIFIMLPLYLGFTPVGKNLINGVQGRYFIPIVLISAILLLKTNIKNDIKYFVEKVMYFQSFLMAYSLILIVFKYYMNI